MRRVNDFYETPPWMTRALTKYVLIHGVVFEPCVGDHSILGALPPSTYQRITNDIDPNKPANFHLDAAQDEVWDQIEPVDWVITNPPFKNPLPLEMLKRATKVARVGVAFMLRLSFLEPTADEKKHPRGPWLSENPPDQMLVMPRHSFTGNGKSDSVTTAWMIWYKHGLESAAPRIECCYGAKGW